MVAAEPPQQSYLTEWWEPCLSDDSLAEVIATLNASAGQLSAEGHPIRLQLAVSVPSDEVLYSVFTADSMDTVTRACRRAGWPANRITDEVKVHIAAPGRGG